jgi:hypothetical protein
MTHPFRRSAAPHRPTLVPPPGTQAFEVDSDGLEVTEGNDDSDWAMWEDSVHSFDIGALPIDPFGNVGKNHA